MFYNYIRDVNYIIIFVLKLDCTNGIRLAPSAGSLKSKLQVELAHSCLDNGGLTVQELQYYLTGGNG